MFETSNVTDTGNSEDSSFGRDLAVSVAGTLIGFGVFFGIMTTIGVIKKTIDQRNENTEQA